MSSMAKLKSKSYTCFADFAKHYFPANLCPNVVRNDEKLLETCWWLVMSGFPQYVQLYKDDKLPIPPEDVARDHCFFNSEELEYLNKRMAMINQLHNKKLPLPHNVFSKMASCQEFQHCLSCKWSYDKLSCSWMRLTNQDEPRLSRTKESLSSSSSSPSSSSSSTISANKSRSYEATPGGQTPNNNNNNNNNINNKNSSNNNNNNHDNNSCHMTSGYESEISPLSTCLLERIDDMRTSIQRRDVNKNYRSSNHNKINNYNNNNNNNNSNNNNNAKSDYIGNNGGTDKDCNSSDDGTSMRNHHHHLSRHHHHHLSRHHHHDQTNSSPPLRFIRRRKGSGYYDNVLEDASLVGEGDDDDDDVSDGVDDDHDDHDNDAKLELDLILKEFYRDIGEYEVFEDFTKETIDPAVPVMTSQRDTPDDQVFDDFKMDFPVLSKSSPYEERLSSTDNEFVSIHDLTASQFAILRKLCTLKLSGMFDKFDLPSDFLSITERTAKDQPPLQQQPDKLFGVHPSLHLKRTGRSLPSAITNLMMLIEESSKECVGIFRKPGVQSRILALQKHIDLHADEDLPLDVVDPYDGADVFKRYLRDVPESLLTDHLCSSFSLVFSSLPSLCVTQCLQHLIVLLPDVNRSILHEVFHFLHRISRHAALNQMTPANMAVCFLPSLFRMNDLPPSNSNILTTSSSSSSCWDHKSALMCLTQIIERPQDVFCISKNLLEIADKILVNISSFTYIDNKLKTQPFQQTQNPRHVTGFLFSSMKNFNMYRGWTQIKSKSFPGVNVSISSERNGSFLPSWKCQLEILAPPVEIINKIHEDSQPWVGHLLAQKVLERKAVDEDNVTHEIISYEFLIPDAVKSRDGHENEKLTGRKRRTCELRAWKTDLPKESCFYCSKSVLEDKKEDGDNANPPIQLVESSFFLEPCGEGVTSLTHISTVDLVGHSIDWYELAFPSIILGYFTNLQLYFRRQIANARGPETKL